MTPFDQLHQHAPPDVIGDCERTCFACLLDVPPAQVPHIAEMQARYGMTSDEGRRILVDWLAAKGHGLLQFTYPQMRGVGFSLWPAALCIAGGRSPRGYAAGHAVVWQMDANGGAMVHDPNPARLGLAGEPEDVIFLIPFIPRAAA